MGYRAVHELNSHIAGALTHYIGVIKMFRMSRLVASVGHMTSRFEVYDTDVLDRLFGLAACVPYARSIFSQSNVIFCR